MTLAEAINGLTGATAELKTLSTDLNAAKADVTALNAEILRLQALVDTAPKAEAITDLENKVSAITGKFDAEKLRADKAELDLKAEQEGFTPKLNAEVARVCAANGFKAPVETVLKNGGSEGANTKTRDEFNAMSPADRTAFSKSGGKLTD